MDENAFMSGIKQEQQTQSQAMTNKTMTTMNKNNNDVVIGTLFNLIATDNHPVPPIPDMQQPQNQGHNQGQYPEQGGEYKRYVDIWVFLTLLKCAAEEDRRSFDSKTSNTAHNVEFWNQNRAPVRNEAKKHTHFQSQSTTQSAKDFMDSNKANMIRHTSKSTLNRENMSGKSGMMRQGLMDKELCSNERVWDDSEVVRTRQKERSETVAALLSSHANKTNSMETRGRGVVGTLQSEMNRDRVVDVLHSPIKTSQAKVVNDDFKPRKKAWASTEQTWHDTAINVAQAAVRQTEASTTRCANGGNNNNNNGIPNSNGTSVFDSNGEDQSLPPSQTGVKHDYMINYMSTLNKGSLNTHLQTTNVNDNADSMSTGSGAEKHYKNIPPVWERDGAAVAAAMHPSSSINTNINTIYDTSYPEKENHYDSFNMPDNSSAIDTKTTKTNHSSHSNRSSR